MSAAPDDAAAAAGGGDRSEVDDFAARIFQQVLDGMEALAVYVGDRLGLYRLLASGDALSIDEFARRTGMHPRYAREWLEQQAVSGILTAQDDGDGVRFRLPGAHAEVLADERSLAYTSPAARMLVAAASRLPELLEAYRGGGGVSWEQFGADARDAQGDMNRPWFERALGEALAGVPAVHEVLSRPGARLADVGCGHGWSTIALARAYPEAEVLGVDVDAPSLEAARLHAVGMPAVSFRLAAGEDLADLAGTRQNGRLDAAFIFEALHDMPDPVGVLRAIHDAVKDDGVVVVMDEAVADRFAPDGDEIDRIMYAYSLFICLPDSMSTPDSVATGTVMRPATLDAYARAAGFSGIEVLPIDGFAAFRFYRLLV
ncbi:MAG: methyltransferase domain-containing protein [Microbacterium pygmaeum]